MAITSIENAEAATVVGTFVVGELRARLERVQDELQRTHEDLEELRAELDRARRAVP